MSGAAGGEALSPFGRSWRATLLAALLAAAVHLPALRNGFVLDDHMLVEQSDTIERPFDLAPIWLGRFFAQQRVQPPYYRPVVTQSLALNRWLTGPSPVGFHAVNLLLHALAAALLHRAARRLLPGGGAPLLAALLFAVHPLASEPVDAIYGRTDLLAGALALAAMLAHLRAAGRGGGARFALPAGLYLLALLSKESAAPLPLVLLALDAVAAGGFGAALGAWRERGRAWALYGAALAGYAALRVAALGGVVAGDPVEFIHNPLVAHGPASRLLTAPLLLVRYLQLWLLPLHQSPNYSYDELPVVTSLADPRFLYCAPLALGFALLGLVLARRRHPAFAGWAHFGGFYLLVANVFLLVGALLAERFLYLPMAGLCLMAGAAAGGALERRGAARGLAAAALALLGAVAWSRTSAWRSDEALARATIDAAPRSAFGYNNLGVAILGGDLPGPERAAQALAQFERALAIYPDYPGALLNAGNVLLQVGRAPEAAALLERLDRLGLDYKGGTYLLGLAYLRLGRRDEALARLEQAARRWPDEATFSVDYAAVLEEAGRDEEARAILLRAVSAAEPPPNALFNLALVEVKLGLHAEALPRLRALLERAPSDAAARTLLGRALDGEGREDEAMEAFRQALRDDPALAEGWYRLGLLQLRRGDPEGRASLDRAAALGHPLHEGESLPELSEPAP